MKGTVLAKGKMLEWSFNKNCALETDGEAWEEKPASGTVQYGYKVNILVRSKEDLNHRRRVLNY